MTAVEWLINELEEQKLIKLDKMSTILFNKNFATRYEIIVHQAKEMEKEQIINAHGNKKRMTPTVGNYLETYTGQQYYNETYNK